MKIMKIKLLAALAAVAALGGGTASAVQATTFSDVNALSCAFNGGQTTRPAGTELRLRIGENSYNQGNLIAGRNAETTSVVINGGAPIDLTDNFRPITFEDPFLTRNSSGLALHRRASSSRPKPNEAWISACRMPGCPGGESVLPLAAQVNATPRE
jgi:hypothetical protein